MTKRRAGVLEPVRARVRRVQLIVGLGVLSVIGGAVIAPFILLRLAASISTPSVTWLVVFTIVGQLWVWAVMPGLLYAVARVIEIRPWSAPVGAAITGSIFVLSLGFITRGLESITEEHPARLATLLLTTVAGVLLGRLAILSARAAVARTQQVAEAAAAERKNEYDEFAKEAERLAALHEASRAGGDAAPASLERPAVTAAGGDVAPASLESPAVTAAGGDVAPALSESPGATAAGTASPLAQPESLGVTAGAAGEPPRET